MVLGWQRFPVEQESVKEVMRNQDIVAMDLAFVEIHGNIAIHNTATRTIRTVHNVLA